MLVELAFLRFLEKTLSQMIKEADKQKILTEVRKLYPKDSRYVKIRNSRTTKWVIIDREQGKVIREEDMLAAIPEVKE
jgi:hypothetical protein